VPEEGGWCIFASLKGEKMWIEEAAKEKVHNWF